jgi:hypothetical protein
LKVAARVKKLTQTRLQSLCDGCVLDYGNKLWYSNWNSYVLGLSEACLAKISVVTFYILEI